VNPGSGILLSGEMMLRHLGWKRSRRPGHLPAMDGGHSASKRVTYDFARLMDGATQVSCSGFGRVMIEQME
jgi:isocitrate dehydrogenase